MIAPASADHDLGVGRGRCRAAPPGSSAPGPCGCGRRCRRPSRGRGRTSRRTRLLAERARSPGGCRCRPGSATAALPALTRGASVCGSRRSATSTSLAALISSAVRWRMNSGLPRQMTLIDLPFGDRREVELDRGAAASVAARGFIWSMSGQASGAAADGRRRAGGDMDEVATVRVVAAKRADRDLRPRTVSSHLKAHPSHSSSPDDLRRTPCHCDLARRLDTAASQRHGGQHGAQCRQPLRSSRMHLRDLPSVPGHPVADRLECVWPFFNRTFRKTSARAAPRRLSGRRRSTYRALRLPVFRPRRTPRRPWIIVDQREVARHVRWAAFELAVAPDEARLVLFTTRGRQPLTRLRLPRRTTSCCSAGRAPACPTRCTQAADARL